MQTFEADAPSVAATPAGDAQGKRSRDPIGGAIIFGFLTYMIALVFAWLLFKRLTPDTVTLAALGRHVAIQNLHQHVLNHALELAVIFPAIMVLEMAITGWDKSSLRHLTMVRGASSRSDFVIYMLWETKLMNGLILLMSFGLSLATGVWLHDRITAIAGIDFTVAAWPVAAQLPLLFLVFSFFDYWNHRLDHSSYFWPLHRFHHAADDFCVLTASRVHPAVLTGVISGVGPSLLLGASPDAAFDLVICTGLLRYVIHSRIDTNFGLLGRWAIQSPNHHRLHHVRDISVQPVGHYSLCPLWDHAFGTWRGEADQTLRIGVDDAPYRHGAWIWPDLWRDYCAFWKGFAPRKRAPAAVIEASTGS